MTDVIILKDTGILLDEPIEVIQQKSHRIKNYYLDHKNTIQRDSLGGFNIQDIYDDLTPEEIQKITDAGGSVEFLDLQTLFNDFMEV